MKKNCCLICLSLVLTLCATGLARQDDENDKVESKQTGSATIKGRLVQNDNAKFKIDLAELKPILNQQIQLPQPPIPDNWPEMTDEKRQTWVKEFEASDKGKAFLADRKKRLESAANFPIQLEDDGNFVVYDVPHGTYGIRGLLEKKIDDKNYVLEVFGQINIAEKVDEVLLDPMMVSVTRRLSKGESIPEFEIVQFGSKAKINNQVLQAADSKQKFILLYFWSMQSPPSQQFYSVVQEACASLKSKHPIQLFSVCVGPDLSDATKFLNEKEIPGLHGHVSGWEHNMINEFGIRILPSLYLLSPEQKIAATDSEFRMSGAMLGEKALVQFIVDAISGKDAN